MMMASTEGAMAFSKGLGAVHSMSHAIGADQELRLHHGTLNGVILPTILRFNKDHVGDKYARIARAMGKAESVDLADEIEKLNEKNMVMQTGVECEFFLLSEDGTEVDDKRDTAAKPCYDQSILMR